MTSVFPAQAWVSALLAGVLFLASPRKSSQKEGDPRVGAGYAGPLRYSPLAGAAELGPSALRQSSPFFRQRLRCSAPLRGTQRRPGSGSCPKCYGRAEKMPKIEISQFGHGWFTGPLERRRATQAGAEKGRALFEARRAELRSPRASRVAQGTGAAGADPGSPSFCLLFLGEARKSETPLKGGKTRQYKQAANRDKP
jgi:hypothetical protein